MFDMTEDVTEHVAASFVVPAKRKRSLKFSADGVNVAELCDIASNPNTSSEVLLEIASTRIRYVDKNVAMNPNSTLDVLKVLFENNKGRRVRDDPIELLIKNRNMTLEYFLEIVATHTVDKFSYNVGRDNSTPPEVLKLLATMNTRSPLMTEILLKNSNSTLEVFETIAAHGTLNPRTRDIVMTKLTNSDKYRDWPVEWLNELFTPEGR